jgi:3-(methylthio)propionyl---CoA ligase
MNGRMMQMPLLVSSLLEHAARHHGNTEIVSRRVEGDIHRMNYAQLGQRARQVANVLYALSCPSDARIATLAWNGYRHLELYYGVSGSGRILHTLNPRLHLDQMAYIVNHAQDHVLCFDLTFWPLVEKLLPLCPHIGHVIALCADGARPAILPASIHSYETLVESASATYSWPSLDEHRASSLCYTSGTAGQPKGVLYSHRSTVLHTYASALPDSLNLSARDTVLPVVPMFHVNAWGLPYSAAAVGAKLVLPGPGLDGASLYQLFEQESVTLSAGVPTVWQGLLAHVSSQQLRFSTMNRTIIGGSACPPAMIKTFEEGYGVRVIHAWGMTEMSPLGTACVEKAIHAGLPADARAALQAKQGRVVYGVDMKIVDESGIELPWDGQASGDLYVRGPWTVASYFELDGAGPDMERTSERSERGPAEPTWFATGDVATIDGDGYMQITDRSKDVIKSGGEWISSIAIENIAAGHPGVAMAACIGVAHPKWDERPLLVVVQKAGSVVGREELLAFFDGKIAKWWRPDDVVFVDAIPLGATGKMLKARLRTMFKDHVLPG